ncbi:acyl--CoA ligase [Pseudoalteromonas luteoviolacea]|nr:acyl--CoA ligase [Pseudoalteromonas luteoviolacea]
MIRSSICTPTHFSFVSDLGEVKSSESFWRDCCLYSQKLRLVKENLDGQSTLTAVLFDSTPYSFGYKLFALLINEFEVVLPNNSQPCTLQDAASHADIVCGNALGDMARSKVWVDGLPDSELNRMSDNIDWPLCGSVVFSTSGSTGKSKQIRKSWQSLQLELDTLLTTFDMSSVKTFISTVPHYHIYGLLFRLLLPMKLGAQIYPTKEYPEHIVPLVKTAGKQHCILISSPAFLKRLCNDNVLSVSADRFCHIFSSGGKLEQDTATKLYAQMRFSICEIYGSTESGGIAHRKQTNGPDALWTLFRGMSISAKAETQQLVLRSPYLNFQPLAMDDKVALHASGQFKLLGRIDRTVKVEEKRVNLSDLERTLEAHAWVQSCKVILLEGKRTALAAVVVLKQEKPAYESKRRLNQALRQHLASKFELICIPKKWRYVEEFPINNQGKTTTAALEKLFE